MTAFVFVENYTFTWPVTVRMPKSGGGFSEHSFEAEFVLVDEQDLFDRQDVTSASEAIDIEVKRFSEIWVGFEGIYTDDHQQKPMASTPENIAKLLRRRNIRIGVTEAYQEAVLNGAVRSKN